MSGPQRAAVALYALAPEDRELILAELQPIEQDQLRAQLREMQELGFERGALPLLGKAGASRSAKDDWWSSVDAASLFSLIEHEPAALIAEVLALRAWPCRDALLSLFPAGRRSAIAVAQTAVGGRAPAPARRAWLEQALHQRLAATVGAPPASMPTWRQWLQKASAWKR